MYKRKNEKEQRNDRKFRRKITPGVEVEGQNTGASKLQAMFHGIM